MAWNISGTYWAPCSCKVGCPCALGEMEADHGWCSGTIAVEIRKGTIDGVDVSGTKAVLAADWPSGFLGGNGKGRVYLDSAMSAQQRTAVEGVVTGKKGGALEAISALVPTLLSAKEAPITIERKDDVTHIKVGNFGELVSTRMRGASGEFTRLLHAAAAFRDDTFLSRGTGTHWKDPDLRKWESSGHSEEADFDWSA
jgi:hypothetical protein